MLHSNKESYFFAHFDAMRLNLTQRVLNELSVTVTLPNRKLRDNLCTRIRRSRGAPNMNGDWMNTRSLHFLYVLLLGLGLPVAASAGGFEYGPQGLHAVGRGGAFTVAADDPTAVFWNPSRLALMDGTHVIVNLSMSLMQASFKRADAYIQTVTKDPETGAIIYGPIKDPQPDKFPHEFETERNTDQLFPLGASFFITSDFGLKDWGFGIGLHGPTAVGKVTWSSAFDSSNKYFFSGMDTTVLYLDLAAAWKYKEWFGLGVTFQYVMVPYLKYRMTIMGPAAYINQNTPISNSMDIQADVDVSDWGSFSMLAGFWVRPLQMFKGMKKFEIGFNARVVPYKVSANGNIGISGVKDKSLFSDYQTTIPGRLSFTYPAHVQIGARYAWDHNGREIFDIEADYVWENWAALETFEMKMMKEFKGHGFDMSAMDVSIPRNFVDSHSVRLGGQWNAIDQWLTARLGFWYESAAQPEAWTNLDLPSWERFGIGFGLSTEIRGFEIGFSYAHVFHMPRNVTNGGITQQVIDTVASEDGTKSVTRPGYVVNNGEFTNSIDVFTFGIGYHHKPKAKRDFPKDPVPESETADEAVEEGPEPSPEDPADPSV